MTIGIDRAGGTSYTDLIPHLLGSSAAGYTTSTIGMGIRYYFPIFIKAGSSIAAKASVNNATAGNVSVWATLYGLPSRPELIRAGSFVEAIGITTSTSSGTAVTSGTASEGSWTSLGSPAKNCWWWQWGFGISDSTMGTRAYTCDFAAGDASNKRLIFENEIALADGSELVMYGPGLNGGMLVTPSDTLYARMQCSGTADSNLSAAMYGLGG